MKITNISKAVTYYVTTDDPEFPDYRVDETGTNLEVRMGESWEPILIEEGEFQKMIYDYIISNGVKE